MNILLRFMAVGTVCLGFLNSAKTSDSSCNAVPLARSAQPVNESAQVKKTIIAFLQWYKANLEKANGFPLLQKDSTGYFELSSKAVADYLNFMRASRFISEKYIAHWKIYFKDKATMLKEEKIASDVPEGFDFDLVLISQEPEQVLNKIPQLKLVVVSISKTTALVNVKLPSAFDVEYEFEMYKEKDGWRIGYISTANYD